MDDPYKVLGLNSSATEEEVTAAYRKLAKKYHPDLNPGDKEAEKKMRQVNAAYEAIKTQKTGGAKYERADGTYGPQERSPTGGRTYRGEDPFGGFDFGGFGFEDLFGSMFGGAWQQQQSQRQNTGTPMERKTRQYIENGQYEDAMRVLNQMPKNSGEWYYLSALANLGVGNRVTALNHAKEAVQMEPDNLEYQRLLLRFQQGGSAYRQAGQRRGFDMQTMGRSMLQLLLAQMFCLFCCRPC